jgi:predicted Zn-dependent peptidase
MPGTDFDYKQDRAACAMFNEYMSGSMAGIFFQEIREMRSLAYSTYGYYTYDRFNRKPSHYYGYVSTQCDKTEDAIAAMRDLMITFPDREAKFQGAQDYLVSVRNSSYLTFRSLPGHYRRLVEEEKTDRDERVEVTEEIGKMNYRDLQAFHKKYIEGRPMVIFISGNAKKFDLKALGQYGKVQEVKYKDMIKF